MDLKLQQALAATRAGSPETAQIYLAELIQEKPDEPDAWFLLSYLVDSSDRQARYLQQVLALDANHGLAREHLERLMIPGVPAPVIRNGKAQPASSSNGDHTAVSSASSAAPSSSSASVEAIAAEQLPEWLQDLEHKRLGAPAPARTADQEWASSAGAPKREKPQAQTARPAPPPPTAVRSVPAPASEPQTDHSQKMLLGILLALIVMSLLVLVFLVLQIF
jgi:hypothetical protein